MKKLLIAGLGVLLMGMQFNLWAATCATEKKGKGYVLRVLSPGPGTIINKGTDFLLEWYDPGQSLGIKVNVGLHKLKGKKKVAKAVKKLLNQPNTGFVLATGANLSQPGAKAKAKDQYFLRVSGKGKMVIDSECFTFAPAPKGAGQVKAGSSLATDAQINAILRTNRWQWYYIQAISSMLADLKKQVAAGGLGEAEREELMNEIFAEHHRLNNEERYVSWPGLEFVLEPRGRSIDYIIEKMQHLCRRLGVEAFGVTECALLNPGSGE